MKKRANDVAKNRGRLMKTASSSLLPVSPYSTDSFRNRSNSSASSCDETMSSLSSRLSADESLVPSSPFRQRSYSNTSSTSTSYSASGLIRNYTDDLNYDFDNIKLDDQFTTSLGSDFIREYLSTQGEEEMICEETGGKKETKSVTVTSLTKLVNRLGQVSEPLTRPFYS